MESFNRLAARKEIGAIRHRLVEDGLSDTLRHQIIARHLANLTDTLPQSFHPIIERCQVFNYNDPKGLLGCLDELDELIPATYGSIPAGTVFQVNGPYFIKRKEGAEYRGIIGTHLPADAVITIVNDRSI